MVKVGVYNVLRVVKEVDFGFYLDGDPDEILLPKRYVPEGLKVDDELEVFVYHDNEQRLIATTARPFGVVGDIVSLEVNETTSFGAFLKWGIMKDIFVPISQQETRMKPGDRRFVKIVIDEQTGRIAATEKIDKFLSNLDVTVKENEQVDLIIYKKTDIGYKAIINSKHLGLLHSNQVFRELEPGDRIKGFVKHIRPDFKIDLVLGSRGYAKVSDEEEDFLQKLRNSNNYLPFNDKSLPEDIYAEFGISKKTFKMILGALYKKRLIEFTQTGVKLLDVAAGGVAPAI